MPESWEDARAKCQAALGQLVEGNAEAFKSLWSRSDDIVIMGAFGGFEHGWEQVAERLEWASAGIGASGRRVENLLTAVGEDLACTVDLEHMERTSGGRTYHRVLRCTQVYRLEDGEWKVIVRHADELPEKDSHQR
jgi:ketosteroid isomerase-like protein